MRAPVLRGFFLFLGMLGLACAAFPAAAAPLPKQRIDWVSVWGALEPTQHSVKEAITRALETCADDSVSPSEIEVYFNDTNSDGLTDYTVDLKALRNRSNPSCDALPCVGNDCYVWSFVKREPGLTQIKTEKPKGATCPSRAADNTDCLDYCDATYDQCPLLFRDVFDPIWNSRAGAWNFYHPAGLPAGRSLAPNPSFGLVLAVTLHEKASLCNAEEIAENGGVCVKFFQWDGTLRYLRDIWRPVVEHPGGWPEEDAYNLDRFNKETFTRAKGAMMGEGEGFRLHTDAHFAINTQVGDKTLCLVPCPSSGTSGRKVVELDEKCKKATQSTVCNIDKDEVFMDKDGMCFEPCYEDFEYGCNDVKNTYEKDYFVPNRTPTEFSSFYNHLPTGVTVQECERRYGKWYGNAVAADFLNSFPGRPLDTSICGRISVPCNSAVVVTAQRNCETSLGLDVDCSQCNGDTRIAASERALTCLQEVVCVGPPCPAPVDCVASATRVLMKGGKSLPIEKLKAGDMVMGFASGNTKNMIPARVKKVTVTPGMPMVTVNGVTVTANHEFATQGRGKVTAAGLRLDDLLLRSDGTAEPVKTLQRNPDKGAAYGLVLDGADGFVADGRLVHGTADRKEPAAK